MYLHLLTLTIANIICVICAPVENQPSVYDYSKFEEVYDQRQNGSENYKVDVDGVVVVWAAPESALSALTLLELGLLEGDYSDLEELSSPQVKPPKPENLLVVSPEKPSSSTTTALPPSVATESGASQGGQNDTARHEHPKRKYRIPLFIRPFLGRRD